MPKITIVVGGSFGAGNYALCGKAYDPRFILAWPNARYAVMGAAQASDTVFSVLARSRERGDKKATPEELEQLRAKVKETYEEQTDIRYGAARGWLDAIIQPHETRDVLVRLLGYVARWSKLEWTWKNLFLPEGFVFRPFRFPVPPRTAGRFARLVAQLH